MVDKLIAGIAKTIKDAFGERYRVYTENVGMGAEKPCFFIECEKAEQVRLLGERYMIRAAVTITLEEDGDETKRKTQEVAGKIFNAIQYIEIDGRLYRGMGLNLRFEKSKAVARGIYDIPPIVKENEERIMMETISIKEEGLWTKR